MKKYVFASVFLVLNQLVYSQNNYYVQFSDKYCTEFSLSNPQQFLSGRAIQRRLNQRIAIDSLDLPVCKDYLDSLKNHQAEIILCSKWLNGVTIAISDTSQLTQIENLPFVNFVQCTKNSALAAPARQNIVTQNNDYQINTYQNTMIGVDLIHNAGFRGDGKTIAVLDAGFPNVNTMSAFDFIRPRILGTYNFVDMTQDVYRRNSHGTMVLSTIGANIPNEFVGTAPGASFWLFLTEDVGSETIREMDNWIAAAEMADSVGADIITSSLGYYFFDDAPQLSYSDLDGKTTRISRVATIAARKGIVVLNAAGNEGNSEWHHIIVPADADSILTIGGVDYQQNPSSFTSFGPASDGRIKPTIATQGTMTTVVYNDQISTANGTSFATPIAAGMMACLWQALPNLTNMELISKIIEFSSQYQNPDNQLGYGVPNAWAAYESGITKIYDTQKDNVFSAQFIDDFLRINNCILDNYTIFIYDVSARIIFRGQGSNNSNFYIPNIDKGVYIVHIISSLGRYSKKTVK
ncbi:MAG: S8 family peptidase [Prevotellaceae bacterium]|jgi:subtilisin family serine protease|nr:S8 family peptidase [Prevotellaceae bacterium]